MRRLIMYHLKNYKSNNFKKRYKTKEFITNLVLMCIVFLSSYLLITYNDTLRPWQIKTLFGSLGISGTSMFLLITYLERRTEYFVNDNTEYREDLEQKLKDEFSIKRSSQLEIAIKTVVEERDKNIKKLGVTTPYIAIGITLIVFFANNSGISEPKLILYFLTYFFSMFLVHITLKFVELFFNIYADNLTNLINILKQIQIKWLLDEEKGA